MALTYVTGRITTPDGQPARNATLAVKLTGGPWDGTDLVQGMILVAVDPVAGSFRVGLDPTDVMTPGGAYYTFVAMAGEYRQVIKAPVPTSLADVSLASIAIIDPPLPATGLGIANLLGLAAGQVPYGTSGAPTAFDLAGALNIKAAALVPTAVQTANYIAAAGDLVPVDTTAGPVTITLPNAPADRTRVAVKLVVLGAGNPVTIARAGLDVFNKAGGSTSLTLSLLNQAINLQYASATGIWYVVADDLPLGDLDARFAPITGIPESSVSNLVDDLAAAVHLAGAEHLTGAKTIDAAYFGGAPWSDVKAFGALGDGATNDGPSIRSLLAAVGAAGGGTVYLPPGTFLWGDATTGSIPANTVLRGAGRGVTSIKLGPGLVLDTLLSLDGDHAELHDLTVDGNSANETGNGINLVRLNGCNYGVIADCWLKNSRSSPTGSNGDAVYITGGATYNKVERCLMTGIGRLGCGLVWGSHNVVRNNIIDSPGQSGFDYEPNLDGNLCEYNEILDNIILSPHSSAIFLEGSNSSPSHTGSVKHTKVHGNVIVGGSLSESIRISSNCDYSSCEGNIIVGCPSSGIHLVANNIVCVGNSILDNAANPAIDINGTGCTVSGNRIAWSAPTARAAIFEESTANANFIGTNSVTNSTATTPISVHGAATKTPDVPSSVTSPTTTATIPNAGALALADSTAGNFTITLGNPAVMAVGTIQRVIKTSADTNVVTVRAAGTTTIDGTAFATAPVKLYSPGDSVSVISDGTNWQLLAYSFADLVFTASGSFTVPAGWHMAELVALGGGGGGGGGGTGHATAQSGGAGGAAGLVSRALTPVTPGTVLALTVAGQAGGGAGGAAGGNAGTAGTVGVDSTITGTGISVTGKGGVGGGVGGATSNAGSNGGVWGTTSTRLATLGAGSSGGPSGTAGGNPQHLSSGGGAGSGAATATNGGGAGTPGTPTAGGTAGTAGASGTPTGVTATDAAATSYGAGGGGGGGGAPTGAGGAGGKGGPGWIALRRRG